MTEASRTRRLACGPPEFRPNRQKPPLQPSQEPTSKAPFPHPGRSSHPALVPSTRSQAGFPLPDSKMLRIRSKSSPLRFKSAISTVPLCLSPAQTTAGSGSPSSPYLPHYRAFNPLQLSLIAQAASLPTFTFREAYRRFWPKS